MHGPKIVEPVVYGVGSTQREAIPSQSHHPFELGFEIKKVYRATLDRKPSKEHMLQLVEGVELEDGMMAFEQCGFVEEGKETVLGVEIKSGRNRIVRRMFEHFGYEVTA